MTARSRLLLVRHAEPVDGDRCHGARSDPGLSPDGSRQARAVAARLVGLVGPEPHLVTSPLTRAQQTAVPIAAALGADAVSDERWRERDFGDWEGRPWTELWPTVDPRHLADAAAYTRFTPPGGEPSLAVAARVGAAVRDLRTRPGTTVVVAHAGPIRQALATALGLDLAATLRIAVDHARIACLDMTDDAATLALVGA